MHAPGEVVRVLVVCFAPLLFYFPLGSGGIPASGREAFPLRILGYWKMGMQADDPRNLEIVGGLKTSTLNERTRACISPHVIPESSWNTGINSPMNARNLLRFSRWVLSFCKR